MDPIYVNQLFENLDDLYGKFEALRYQFWWTLLNAENWAEPEDEYKNIFYQVDEADGIYRVTFFDYLPRSKNLEQYSIIRKTWQRIAIKAFKEVSHKYEQLFMYFIIYLPNNIWDVDNRPVKFIIDGARYAGIIPDDNYKHMAYGVQGEIDREYPRIEVYLFDGKPIRQQALNMGEKFPELPKIKPDASKDIWRTHKEKPKNEWWKAPEPKEEPETKPKGFWDI